MHIFILSLYLAATPQQQLDDLLKHLSSQSRFQANYHETKTVAFLKQPLVSDGRLDFKKPDHLVKTVDKPQTATITMKGTEITIESSDGTQHIDLNQYPPMRQFTQGLLALLRGDKTQLLNDYDVSPVFKNNQWTIALTPKASNTQALITRMVFEGSYYRPTRMVMIEKNGDVTITQFYTKVSR